MLHQIPHKNLIASILVAISVFGVGMWMHRSSKQETNNDVPPIVATENKEVGDRDSDGDGLPDWQEALYGTDMNNPDSDGDGTRDGDEVRVGRNPAKAGPDDKMIQLDPSSFAASSTDLALKKAFYAQFLKERGDIVREATVKELLKRFNPSEFAPRYTLVNLKVTSRTDPEALREYGNAFGKLITTYTKKSYRNETEILHDAMVKKDRTVLPELELPSIGYRNFTNDLLALPVPIAAAKYHLQIVNGYDLMGRSLLALTHLFEDPIRGEGAYQTYLKQTYEVTLGYTGLVKYFKNEHIVFKTTDEGHYWGTGGRTLNSTSTKVQLSTGTSTPRAL